MQSEKPATFAPILSSHMVSHEPLKPEWPVTRTLLSLYTLKNMTQTPDHVTVNFFRKKTAQAIENVIIHSIATQA